jgi:hypothetical protein
MVTNIKHVFDQFILSLLNLHHFKGILSFSTNLLTRVFKSLSALPKVVSSANILHRSSNRINGRSFIMKRKKGDPERCLEALLNCDP